MLLWTVWSHFFAETAPDTWALLIILLLSAFGAVIKALAGE
jgi:hypothetical protein